MAEKERYRISVELIQYEADKKEDEYSIDDTEGACPGIIYDTKSEEHAHDILDKLKDIIIAEIQRTDNALIDS